MDLSTYSHSFSLKNKISRLLWNFIRLIVFRPFGSRLFKKWRVLVLKCFGAKIEWSSHIYASVKIWAPWNLEIGANSSLGPNVDCYNQGNISIGSNTIISQKTYLCASTHEYTKKDFPLILKPIKIGNGVWIAADAFIGPAVVIGNNAVIAARSVIIKNVEKNTIVGGNPAKLIKSRNFE
ncbi:putative colanic acid biosynthesis acetyltransferase [Flavobacterium franklandianum]|uniref:putative colanic acid biosynthesis acetyltransferase n=1 Tax=Flavobacterium franklandianum TaxID=2594430 RepID=UPI00117A7348|nr:putative colanic acid biosynthesis acetyltransferase [Flavobacterium franklandianum]TRX27572.1 putative colanic acid biosynthesis acetyltransferase [Flavobacterium franklandianum]